MSTTLLALKRLIAKEMGYSSGTCSAAGTTLTILDTSTDSPLDPDDAETLYQNAWVEIESDSATPALNVGAIRRISSYVPGSATLTVSRAFSDATTTTQSYGLYQGVPPSRMGTLKGLDEYVNDVLRATYYRTYSLLTLVTDGDMETSGVTNWTATNATRSKVTTNVTTGKQALSVVASANNGGVYSATIYVRATQNYDLVADCTPGSGTATLRLYDITNSAAIDSVTSDELQTRYLYKRMTIPSGCQSARVELLSTSGATVTWDNVSLRNSAATTISLPSWVTNPNQIEDLEYWSGGTDAGAGDGAPVDERTPTRVQWWKVQADHGGATPYKIEFSPAIPSYSHLFVRGLRPYSALSADTDTTDADQDWVKAWALARIYADRKDKEETARWLTEALNLQRTYAPRRKQPIQMARPF